MLDNTLYSASVSIRRLVRESILGSNCPPFDFGFGGGVGLLALDVPPAQKTTFSWRCTSAIATFPLPTGFLRYSSRIWAASSRKRSLLRVSAPYRTHLVLSGEPALIRVVLDPQ